MDPNLHLHPNSTTLWPCRTENCTVPQRITVDQAVISARKRHGNCIRDHGHHPRICYAAHIRAHPNQTIPERINAWWEAATQRTPTSHTGW